MTQIMLVIAYVILGYMLFSICNIEIKSGLNRAINSVSHCKWCYALILKSIVQM